MGRFINADIFTSTGHDFVGNNMFAYCGNNPVNRCDPTGQDWWHWGVAVLAVTALVVASIVTCGGAAAAAMAASAIVTGTCTTVSTTATVLTGAAVGSSIALATTAMIASDDSNSLEEFADYGEAALISTTVGGIVGSAVGYYNATNLCFVAGTLVQTENGSKPIEEIEVGDRVWAWDEETGEVALKPVLETYINETDELVHVFVNGEEIVSTPGHPFYSPVKGWTDAVHLRAGDILVLVNGEYVVVEKIQHELLEAPINVYNFNVDGYHTYFVTSSGVLVHNRCETETHHIVEQNQSKKSGFSSTQIQQDSNKIDIPYEMHRKISGYYSSKQPFTDGMRVRDWLTGKSFEYQSQFGWDVIMKFWE